jgi:hypothetical protein
MQAMLSIGSRASVEWMIAARMVGDTAAKRTVDPVLIRVFGSQDHFVRRGAASV